MTTEALPTSPTLCTADSVRSVTATAPSNAPAASVNATDELLTASTALRMMPATPIDKALPKNTQHVIYCDAANGLGNRKAPTYHGLNRTQRVA